MARDSATGCGCLTRSCGWPYLDQLLVEHPRDRRPGAGCRVGPVPGLRGARGGRPRRPRRGRSRDTDHSRLRQDHRCSRSRARPGRAAGEEARPAARLLGRLRPSEAERRRRIMASRIATVERDPVRRLLVVQAHARQRVETPSGPRLINAYLGPVVDRLRHTRLEPFEVDIRARTDDDAAWARLTGPDGSRSLPSDALAPLARRDEGHGQGRRGRDGGPGAGHANSPSGLRRGPRPGPRPGVASGSPERMHAGSRRRRTSDSGVSSGASIPRAS